VSEIVSIEGHQDPKLGLTRLNGLFSGLIKIQDRIILFNDRYGFGKIYVAEVPGGVVAGSNFNDVVKCLQIRTPDPIGLLEFIRFGYPLDDRTFLKEVRVLRPATCLEIDAIKGTISKESRYWRFEFSEDLPTTRAAARDQLMQILEEAVSDCFTDSNARYAVANSGGLDSRAILAIARSLGADFVSYTFGSPGSDVMLVANRIAKTLGTKQLNFEITPDFLPKYWEVHQERRPMTTLASASYYSAIEILGEFDINVTGIYGDNTFGVHLVDKYRAMTNDEDQFRYHSLADDKFLSGLVRREHDVVKDHYEATLRKNYQPTQIMRFDQWNFENRQFRFITEEGWTNLLGDVEARCPFMNNKVVDFAFSLPFKWRQRRTLFQESLALHYPDVSGIRLALLPYSVSDRRFLRSAKSAAWTALRASEKVLEWNPYPMRSHKHQRDWLLTEPNYSFIEEHLQRPSPLFATMFHQEAIAANVRPLISANWSVTSNLLTAKLWLERYVENIL
jgi:asparagine synthetase B (glutamine-hydrolysing)